ncbi:MAG: MFS transporter [Chloroflexota bacterium]|nr:MFS transporter [Chloroflexota bacterium]
MSFFGIHKLLRLLYILRLGHGPEYVGLFSAASALSFMGMSLPGGSLGRSFGTRRIIFLGSIIMIVGMVIQPLGEFVPTAIQDLWPIGSQMVITAGWSMLNVNLVPALMAAATKRNRNNAYALSSSLKGLGTFLGIISGGMLPGLFAQALHQTLDTPGPYRCALWVSAALGTFGLIPLSFIGQVEGIAPEEREEARGPFPVLPVALMIAYVFLRHGGWAACQAFYNAYLDTDLHPTASSIGLITGTGQFLAIPAALLTPRLTARRSNGWILAATTVGMAISLIPLALIPHWAAAGVAQMAILVLSAIWMPALQVFQMELVEAQWRSMAYGAVSMAMGLSFGSISLLGGYVIAARGYQTLFLLGAGLSMAAAVLMVGIPR